MCRRRKGEQAWLECAAGRIIEVMNAHVGASSDLAVEILLFDSLVLYVQRVSLTEGKLAVAINQVSSATQIDQNR